MNFRLLAALVDYRALADGCHPVITQSNWLDCITGAGQYTLGPGTFELATQFQIPDHVTLSGASIEKTIIVASRAVGNGCGSKDWNPGNPSTRIGFVLGNHVNVGNFTFKGKDDHRFNGGYPLCGGFVFETPGCSDAYCHSPEDIGKHNGNGVEQAVVENVYITGTNGGKPQGAVFITQTRSLSNPSHHITIRNVHMDRSHADGINLHGAVHDALVENCKMENTGDDTFAVWSSGDTASRITFRNNVANKPLANWGNCIALYGGATINIDGLKCYSPTNTAVKFSQTYKGSFSSNTHVTVGGLSTDNGRPDCWFTEGRDGNWEVEGCWPQPGSIRSFYSGLCLDLPGGDAGNNKKLWLWECNGLDTQQWIFDAGSYAIKSAIGKGKYCVDAGADDESAKGTQLFLWECNGLPQQTLGYDSDMMTIYWVGSADASICMDLGGSSLDIGAVVQAWDCTGAMNQKWEVNMDPHKVV